MIPSEGDEVRAVRDRYARRPASKDAQRYGMQNPAALLALQERQRAIIRLLARQRLAPLPDLRLVEVGCGTGGNLLDFLRMGFAPEHLIGLDLLPERVMQARRLLPEALQLHCADASRAEIPAASIDIVFQAVVFSSLLDGRFQEDLARAMWHWLKPGGGILWYDFTYNNPSNADVRGVPLRRVRALFPGGGLCHTRVTLAPPIARWTTTVHPALYTLFNLLPFLRTHVLCWIQKS